MYLVVIGVLSLVLTLSRPLYPLLVQPTPILAVVAAATLLPAIVAAVGARRVLRQLDRAPENPSVGQATFGRIMVAIQMLLALGHGGLLLCTAWLSLCNRVPVVGGWLLVPSLLAIAPFLLAILLVWLAVYPADRAVRQIALEIYLLRGKPVRPVWPLWSYIIYNLRHQVLFILIPMLLILAANDVVVRYPGAIRRATGLSYAPDLLIGLAAVLVAVIAPEILRHVWITQRLPDGPLRDRLLLLARKLRLRFREILVWRSGGLLVNAAVMGVVWPLRYVLITDGMLEQMDDTKVEAVFGHEAGHVKKHHIFFYLLFAFVSGCLVTIFSVRTQAMVRKDYELYELLATALGVAIAVKWGVLFGWVSRRFERQADVYGARTLAWSGLPCTQPCVLHAPPDNPGPLAGGDRLCSTAAHVFADALHEVALLNGIRPEARSWRHSSISSRSRFLQALAADPLHTQRFERRVAAVKVVILLAALVSGAWAAYDLKIWASVAHWLFA